MVKEVRKKHVRRPRQKRPVQSDYKRLVELVDKIEEVESVGAKKLRALIVSGILPDARNARGETPLMRAGSTAFAFGFYESAVSPAAATVLIDCGADVNALDNDGRSVLMHTADTKVAQALIDKGANVNAIDKHGNAVLHYACGRECPRLIVEKLLNNNADPCVQNAKGQTPLMCLLADNRAHEGNEFYNATIVHLAVREYDALQKRDPKAYAEQKALLDAWVGQDVHRQIMLSSARVTYEDYKQYCATQKNKTLAHAGQPVSESLVVSNGYSR